MSYESDQAKIIKDFYEKLNKKGGVENGKK